MQLDATKFHLAPCRVPVSSAPLSLAVRDLVEQLDMIIHRDLVGFAHGTPVQRDEFFHFNFATFTIARYLSWVWTIRPELESVLYRTGEQDHPLSKILDDIMHCLLQTDSDDAPFLLYRSQQLAIGEIMSLERDGRPACRGFVEFVHLYNQKDAYDGFRKWFLPIEVGLNRLVEAHDSGLAPPYKRLIEMQEHLKRLQGLLRAED